MSAAEDQLLEFSPRGGTAATTDAFWLILTAYLSQVVALVLAIVLRKELGQRERDLWRGPRCSLPTPILSLGAMGAAEREIPIALGRGDEEG